MPFPLEPSDGVFAFYWSDHEELEWANGPFDTVEAAKAAALADFETKSYGAEPGDTIYIVSADKRLTVAPDFSKMTEFILEGFGEANEECFGEDGFEGLVSSARTTDVQAEADLVHILKMAFDHWQSTHRLNIKVRTFGQVKDVEQFDLPTYPDNDLFIRERSAKSMGMTLQQFDDLRTLGAVIYVDATTTAV